MPRPVRTVLFLAAAALVALLASGCAATVKPGSLRVAQSLGPVHVHLETCTYGVNLKKGGETAEPVLCGPLPPEVRESFEKSTEASDLRLRPLLAFAVPPGTAAPATITAVGKNGAPNYVYTKSAEAASALARDKREGGDSRPWPPAGTEIVGYASTPLDIFLREYQWNVDADFGLPAPAGGAPFNGTFTTEVADGFQFSIPSQGYPENRPINCEEKSIGEEESEEGPTICGVDEGATIPVSDLKLSPAPPVTGFPGSKQTVSFPAAFASTVTPPPALALSVATSLTGAVAAPATPTLTGTSAGATVVVPKKAKPGKYTVTLAATAPGGGVVSQTGTLTIKAAKPKFGKVKLNRSKGTALVAVKLPGAGTLTVSGKGFGKVTKKAAKAKTLKVNLKAKGSTAAALATVGKATLKAKFKFKPSNGVAVTTPRTVVLKLNR